MSYVIFVNDPDPGTEEELVRQIQQIPPVEISFGVLHELVIQKIQGTRKGVK